jgi:aspartate aminotransferase
MENLQSCKGPMAFLAPSETLAIAAKAKAMAAQGVNVCSMSAGEPDFDTPDHIKDAAIEAIKTGKTKYTPAAGIPDLKKLIAKKLVEENGVQTTPEQIIVAPGAKFSVFSAIAALCGPGDEVIIPAPYWLSYPEMVRACGAKVVPLQTKASNNYELVPEELEAVVTANTKLLIFNSPSNPTGCVYSRKTIEKVAEIAVRKNFMVLSDEIYEKLVYDTAYPHVSIGSLSKEINDLTITVNGFSKAYSMTGWRLGYLSAPLWLAKRIAAFQSHTTSNPTTFVQYAAIKALGETESVEKMRKSFAARRDLIYGLISAIPGVTCPKPAGAFYLFCDISSFGMKSSDFCEKLLETEKVAAIPCGAFAADNCIRLSYACSEANIKETARRLAAFCASLKKDFCPSP